MTEKQLLLLLSFWRQYTLNVIEDITEDEADHIPDGFSNNLRWNIGHILVSSAGLLLPRLGADIPYPSVYLEQFNRGTSPKEWTSAPSSLATLKEELKAQPELLKAHLHGRLDEPLTESFIELDTIGGLVGFAINHEMLHAGVIMGMKKALRNK